MASSCNRDGVEIWAYCLMRNHVYLVAVPKTPEILRSAIGETHRRYTRAINFRNNWREHLWQNRFASFPVNENYLLAKARYVELNPVRTNITDDPSTYLWSSVKRHITGEDDELVRVKPLLELVPDWQIFLQEGMEEENQRLRHHERTGRPPGDESFINQMENMSN